MVDRKLRRESLYNIIDNEYGRFVKRVDVVRVMRMLHRGILEKDDTCVIRGMYNSQFNVDQIESISKPIGSLMKPCFGIPKHLKRTNKKGVYELVDINKMSGMQKVRDYNGNEEYLFVKYLEGKKKVLLVNKENVTITKDIFSIRIV